MYLNGQNLHGGDVYGGEPVTDFSASINPAGMPEAVRRALRESADRCDVYPDPYCRALRRAVGRAEGVPEETVLCGAGASELIYQFALSLPRGKPALILAPAFSEYAAALRAAGVEAEYHILTPEAGFRLTGDILNRDLSGYSAVLLASPANPTGITVEPRLIRDMAATKVRILLDLSFLDLTQSPGMYALPALCGEYPNVCALRSPTKSFAIPGVRLGYMICSDTRFLEGMSQRGQCWNVSVPAQAAGEAAMACADWLRAAARAVAAERERLSRGLSALGITVFPGEANYLLAYWEGELVSPLRRRGIALRDCADFVGLKKGYFRVAVRTREENDRLLAAVGEVLK